MHRSNFEPTSTLWWIAGLVFAAAYPAAAQQPAQLVGEPMIGVAAASAVVWMETERQGVLSGLEGGEAVASGLESQEAFEPLFDGESLSGWVVENSDEDNFFVQDSVLRVEGPGGWLRTEGTYTDFDLRVEFRFLTDDSDSGVFVRVEEAGTFGPGWPLGAYQVQTRDVSTNRTENPLLIGDIYRHGMPDGETVYDADAAFEAFRGTGEWQNFEIRVAGDSLLVDLNGASITRARAVEQRAGFIGIQGETGAVEYRTIEIRER